MQFVLHISGAIIEDGSAIVSCLGGFAKVIVGARG
jgi:hypothetical protein